MKVDTSLKVIDAWEKAFSNVGTGTPLQYEPNPNEPIKNLCTKFDIPATLRSTFKIHTYSSSLSNSNYIYSMALAEYLLTKAGMIITPDNDFSAYQGVGFAYTADKPTLYKSSQGAID